MSDLTIKTTQWFPQEISPIRKGWYARKYSGDFHDRIQYMNYWNGKNWFYNDNQLPNEPAAKRGHLCFGLPVWLWRGLVEESK